MNENNTPIALEDWPDSLDAMVAASDHHEILMENVRVISIELRT